MSKNQHIPIPIFILRISNSIKIYPGHQTKPSRPLYLQKSLHSFFCTFGYEQTKRHVWHLNQKYVAEKINRSLFSDLISADLRVAGPGGEMKGGGPGPVHAVARGLIAQQEPNNLLSYTLYIYTYTYIHRRTAQGEWIFVQEFWFFVLTSKDFGVAFRKWTISKQPNISVIYLMIQDIT